MTKMEVADVAVDGTISFIKAAPIERYFARIPLKADLMRPRATAPRSTAGHGSFGVGIVQELQESLGRLLKHAREGAGDVDVQCIAVATAAFRDAENGGAVAAQLAQSLSIQVEVLTQDDESTLGFHSAVAAASTGSDVFGGHLDGGNGDQGATANLTAADVIMWDLVGKYHLAC